ncbi:hypothetical protein ACLIA0_14835 [Bacillaceae bacterium W0354]
MSKSFSIQEKERLIKLLRDKGCEVRDEVKKPENGRYSGTVSKKGGPYKLNLFGEGKY